MSKGQALGGTIASAIITILFLTSGSSVCVMVCLLVTGVFALVWWLKYERDAKIMQEAYSDPMPLLSHAPVTPPMTSPGSVGLKVPAPLD